MTGTRQFDHVARERAGGVWEYVSASRLNLWMRCPLAFRLRYIDGIRTPTTASLFLGKQVHAALETYYRHRQLGLTLAAADVTTRMLSGWQQAACQEEFTPASAAEERALQQQARQLVTAYLGQVPADEPKPQAVEVAMERPLVDPWSGEDLGIPLLGVVDLILPCKAGPTIVDFKTSSRSATPLEVTHEVQLSCYSYLFRASTGQQEASLEIRSLLKTKQPKVEVQTYPARGEVHQRRLFAILREYLDALDRGQFNFRPGWGCGTCEFRERQCRAWRP